MICADLLFIFSSYLQQCYSTNTYKHQIPWELGPDSDQATFPVHKILRNVRAAAKKVRIIADQQFKNLMMIFFFENC